MQTQSIKIGDRAAAIGAKGIGRAAAIGAKVRRDFAKRRTYWIDVIFHLLALVILIVSFSMIFVFRTEDPAQTPALAGSHTREIKDVSIVWMYIGAAALVMSEMALNVYFKEGLINGLKNMLPPFKDWNNITMDELLTSQVVTYFLRALAYIFVIAVVLATLSKLQTYHKMDAKLPTESLYFFAGLCILHISGVIRDIDISVGNPVSVGVPVSLPVALVIPEATKVE